MSQNDLDSVTRRRVQLEKLVNELMADQPDESLVRELSLQVGVPVCGGLVEHMGAVLQKMDQIYFAENEFSKSKTAKSSQLEGSDVEFQ